MLYYFAIAILSIAVSFLIYRQEISIIFILIIISFGFVLFLIKPNWIFFIFIFSLPFTKAGQLRIGESLILPSQILIILFMFFLIFYRRARQEAVLSIPKTNINIPLAIFLMVCILSIFQSYTIPLNYKDFILAGMRNRPFVKSITQVSLLIPAVLSYYLTVSFLKNRELLTKAIKIWFFTLASISIYGIYQFIGYYLKWPYADYYIQSFDFRYLAFLNYFKLARVSSVTLEPTFLPMYIISMLPLAIALLVNKVYIIKRYLLIMLISVSFICLLLTFAANIIFILIGIFLSLIIFLRYWKYKFYQIIISVTAIVLLISVIIYYQQILDKLRFELNTYDYSFHISAFHRTVCWKTAFNMFLKHPFFGVGIGNFAHNFTDNIPHPEILELMQHTGMPRITNNIFLEVLAETGIFGFLSFISIFFFLLKGPIKRIISFKDKFYDTITLGLVLGFMGIMFAHLSSSAFHFPYVWVLMGLITASEYLASKKDG